LSQKEKSKKQGEIKARLPSVILATKEGRDQED
jgi:hypothetical protein